MDNKDNTAVKKQFENTSMLNAQKIGIFVQSGLCPLPAKFRKELLRWCTSTEIYTDCCEIPLLHLLNYYGFRNTNIYIPFYPSYKYAKFNYITTPNTIQFINHVDILFIVTSGDKLTGRDYHIYNTLKQKATERNIEVVEFTY